MAAVVGMNCLTTEEFNKHVIERRRDISPAYRDQYLYRPQSPALQSVMDNRPESYNIPIPAQIIACQDLVSEAKCTHCGWLRKRSFRTKLSKLFSWPQAYAVLNDGCLYYFKRETSKTPSGKFSLYGYSSVFRASDIPSRDATWAFKIVHSHREFKTYYFAAASEKEMKTWMSLVKAEMMKANGKQTRTKGDKDDDPTFYHDVETSIYDDANTFLVTKEYTKQCSVKREGEVSDDEDLDDILHNLNTTIGLRPPQPLPSRAPNPPPRTDTPDVPTKPARVIDVQSQVQDKVPLALPRNRSRTKTGIGVKFYLNAAAATAGAIQAHSVPLLQQDIASKLAALAPKPPLMKMKRKPSYVATDGPGYKSPTLNRKAGEQSARMSPRSFKNTSNPSTGGGSTGEDEVYDSEEYWSSIYFDDSDKQRSHDIIQALCDPGVYMVRPQAAGSEKVLVVYADDQTKKYHIHKNDAEEYYLAKEGFKHEGLEDMLSYYYENDLPTVTQKLTLPYKLHSKYKDLHL